MAKLDALRAFNDQTMRAFNGPAPGNPLIPQGFEKELAAEANRPLPRAATPYGDWDAVGLPGTGLNGIAYQRSMPAPPMQWAMTPQRREDTEALAGAHPTGQPASSLFTGQLPMQLEDQLPKQTPMPADPSLMFSTGVVGDPAMARLPGSLPRPKRNSGAPPDTRKGKPSGMPA